MEPQQKPIADPLTRAAVETTAGRRAAAALRQAPGDTDPGRERMTHLFDQNEAEMDEQPRLLPPGSDGRYLPVMPSKGVTLLRRYGLVRE